MVCKYCLFPYMPKNEDFCSDSCKHKYNENQSIRGDLMKNLQYFNSNIYHILESEEQIILKDFAEVGTPNKIGVNDKNCKAWIYKVYKDVYMIEEYFEHTDDPEYSYLEFLVNTYKATYTEG
jgi:hypothetical protein